MESENSSSLGSLALGSVFAVLQAVLYATMGIFGKLLYATGLCAQEVIVIRFACATVMLGAFLLVWRKQPLISRQPAVYVQAIFFCSSSIFYFMAVEHLTAGMTTVIFYTYPAVVALGSAVFFKEKFTLTTFLALVLALGGLVLVSGMMAGEVALDPLGIAEGIVSCLGFAIYTLLIYKTARVEGPLTVTFTLSAASLIASCVVFAPFVPSLLHVTPEQVGLCCVLALACTILPIPLYIEAVKRIGGTKTSLLGISETPSSLLLAFVILGETLTFDQCLGSLLIVLSIVITTVAPMLGRGKD